jgi:hypothetical protein
VFWRVFRDKSTVFDTFHKENNNAEAFDVFGEFFTQQTPIF